MAQIDYTGTAGADLLDASGLAAGSNAVLRGGAGADTLLGSSGNDRFDGGAGADSMAGGAGNDTFFLAYSAAPGQGFDTIDAGTGADQVVITMNGSQVNDAAVQAELAAINTWSKGDTSVAFNSTLFNFSMVSAETVSVRVDGQVKTLAEVLPPPPPQPVTIDFTGGKNGLPQQRELNGNPYTEDGFTFSYTAVNSQNSAINSGYSPAGEYVFFARSAPTILTKNTGADFDLTSFLYATGYGTGIVKGYHDGTETHSQTLADTNYNWTTATLNWTGVDEVRFSRAGQWSDFSADSFLVT